MPRSGGPVGVDAEYSVGVPAPVVGIDQADPPRPAISPDDAIEPVGICSKSIRFRVAGIANSCGSPDNNWLTLYDATSTCIASGGPVVGNNSIFTRCGNTLLTSS